VLAEIHDRQNHHGGQQCEQQSQFREPHSPEPHHQCGGQGDVQAGKCRQRIVVHLKRLAICDLENPHHVNRHPWWLRRKQEEADESHIQDAEPDGGQLRE
jgi:hypothetical protein